MAQPSTGDSKPTAGARPRGRPREFDEREVLQAAMEVFWERGYQNTSLDHVMERTGLARQSLYRTFGDKRSLFLACLECYQACNRAELDAVFDAGRPAIEGLRALLGLWRRCVEDEAQRGCLLMNSVAEFAHVDDAEVRGRLLGVLQGLEDRLREILRRAQAEGDLPRALKPRQVARSLVAVVQALSVLAAGGAPRPMLRDVLRGAEGMLA